MKEKMNVDEIVTFDRSSPFDWFLFSHRGFIWRCSLEGNLIYDIYKNWQWGMNQEQLIHTAEQWNQFSYVKKIQDFLMSSFFSGHFQSHVLDF